MFHTVRQEFERVAIRSRPRLGKNELLLVEKLGSTTLVSSPAVESKPENQQVRQSPLRRNNDCAELPHS